MTTVRSIDLVSKTQSCVSFCLRIDAEKSPSLYSRVAEIMDRVPHSDLIFRGIMDDCWDDIDERLVKERKRRKWRTYGFSSRSSAGGLSFLNSFSRDARLCEVVMGFSPLEQLHVLRRVGSYSSSCQSQDSSFSEFTFMHWLVDFKFDDSEMMRCDAAEKDGLLKGSITMKDDLPPAEHKIIVGRFVLGSDQIIQAYRALKVCDKYDPVVNNCQTWVVNLLDMLDIFLPPDIKTISEKIYDVFKSETMVAATRIIVSMVKSAFEESGARVEPCEDGIAEVPLLERKEK